jgi:hypothetical protein
MKVFQVALAAAVMMGGASAARAQDARGPATAPSAITASAHVTDEFNELIKVEDPSFFRPASGFSLGGGGKAAKLKELHVWKGAHEITVPLEKILRIEIHAKDGKDADLIGVTITLIGQTGQTNLEGKIERDIELRGRVLYGSYQIRVERAKLIVIRA